MMELEWALDQLVFDKIMNCLFYFWLAHVQKKGLENVKLLMKFYIE